jgi:predicted lipoprotein
VGTQRALSRRALLHVGAAGLVAIASSGCSRPSREEALRALALDVIVAGSLRLGAESQRLEQATLRLAVSPSLDTLRAAHAAFRATLGAWRGASAFRAEPLAAGAPFTSALFWPPRPRAIESVLAASADIDPALIEALPADARGLSALEYLLFGVSSAGSLERSATLQGRRYAACLASNVRGYGERIGRSLGDGRAFAQDFVAGGAASASRALGHIVDALDVARGKLARLERARAQSTPLAAAVEGHRSGSSLAVIRALLGGARALYLGRGGGGLSDVVALAEPAIDRHARRSFGALAASLLAPSGPLEQATVAEIRAIDRALDELHHVLESEARSALEA